MVSQRRRDGQARNAFLGAGEASLGRDETSARELPRGAGCWGAWAAAGMIVLAVLAAYANSFRAPFVFDSIPAITDNPTIRHLWPLGRVLRAEELPAGATVRGRPVVNLSLAINYALGKEDVWGYHAMNVGIHAAAALALLGLMRRTLRLPLLADRFGFHATVLGFATALLWALHPLQTESVTYVIQRAESLMGLFFLLTLYCLNRGATSQRPAAWYAASVCSCVAGMGSKEVMAGAPILAFLYDGMFLAGTFKEALRRRWGLHLALAATWGVLGYVALGARGETAGLNTGISPWSYGLTQVWAVARYLWLTIWPRELVLDYGTGLITSFSRLWVPGLGVLGLLAATGLALGRAPRAGFLGAVFFLVLAPSSSVIPVATQTVAEHRMYLPLAAVAVGVVVGAYALGRRLLAGRSRLGRILAGAAVLVVAACLGAATHLRNRDYVSELAIWEDTVRKWPENPRVQNVLSGRLLLAGDWEGAMRHLDRAIALRPDYAEAYSNRGSAFMQRGWYGLALLEYDRAIELQPNFAQAYNNRGVSYHNRGRYDRAVADYDRALALWPDYAEAYNNRGVSYSQLARYDRAVADYSRAIARRANYAEAYNNRALSYYHLSDYARAWADVEQCRRLGLSPDAEFLQQLEKASGRSR